MAAKAKLRTSEDVIKRLRHVSQWDEDWAGEQDVWIGYDDGVFGPMEKPLSDFATIAEGGDLPYTRLQYLRRGDEVLWDRKRRLDLLWESGDTRRILAFNSGQKVKGFNGVADREAEDSTSAAIAQAQDTLKQMEEERKIAAIEKQKRKLRKKVQKMANQERALANESDLEIETVQVKCLGEKCANKSMNVGLRLATWNILCDDHLEAPDIMSTARAPDIAAKLLETDADVASLQEVTPAALAVIDESCETRMWRTDCPGELCIVSRHPILKALRMPLSQPICASSKRALIVEVLVDKRTIVVACVHLTSDRKGDEMVDNSVKRRAQVAALQLALKQEVKHANIFICGDFNEPSANGGEAAVKDLFGFVDCWPSVHPDGLPGFTFDPESNELAGRFALNQNPRRLDRIFAPDTWHPKSASMFGGASSDHFGVVATFATEPRWKPEVVHTSAVVLLPPDSARPQIDAIRQRFDPSFERWMPHVNLLYGFVPEAAFAWATPLVETATREHGPFEVRFESFSILEHGRSASLVLIPACTPAGSIRDLQHNLESIFPFCSEQSRHAAGFNPHLTVGKFESVEEARHWKTELEKNWVPIVFVVEDIAILARGNESPFAPRTRVPFGATLRMTETTILKMIEATTGCRTFPIGSAAVLGADRPAQSDFDILLVGTDDWDTMCAKISSMPAKCIRFVKEAQFPIITMEVDGVHLDLQYARSNDARHPLHWSGSEGGQAVATLRDAHAIRASIIAAVGFAGWQRYQRALIRLKKWVRSRGVGSNALGFLGGFSWSILLANAALNCGKAHCENDKHEDGQSLLDAMFHRFGSWPWPEPVSLGLIDGERVANVEGLMPVLCPTELGKNSARNVTESTFRILVAEFRLASSGVARGPVLKDINVVIRCQVKANLDKDFAVCSSFVESRFLVLVRGVDSLQARPLKIREGFLAIGLGGPQAKTLSRALEFFQEVLAKDLPDPRWESWIELAVENREEFQVACGKQ